MLGSQFIRKDRGFRARHLFPVLLLHSGVSCLNSPLCPYPPSVTPPDFMSHLSDPCALFLDWVPNLDLFAPPYKHFWGALLSPQAAQVQQSSALRFLFAVSFKGNLGYLRVTLAGIPMNILCLLHSPHKHLFTSFHVAHYL